MSGSFVSLQRSGLQIKVKGGCSQFAPFLCRAGGGGLQGEGPTQVAIGPHICRSCRAQPGRGGGGGGGEGGRGGGRKG